MSGILPVFPPRGRTGAAAVRAAKEKAEIIEFETNIVVNRKRATAAADRLTSVLPAVFMTRGQFVTLNIEDAEALAAKLEKPDATTEAR